MNRNLLYLFPLLLLIIILVYYFARRGAASPGANPLTIPLITETPAPEKNTSQKTFEIDAVSFSFTPNEIVVNQGDTVRIILNNREGFHDWVIDEFNSKTPQIPSGSTESLEFVADKAGTFEYYCSVGDHRQKGMTGKLIVQ